MPDDDDTSADEGKPSRWLGTEDHPTALRKAWWVLKETIGWWP